MLYPPTLQHAVYCSCLEANRATLYTVYHLPHQLPPPPAPATRDPMAKARACSSIVWQRPTRAPSKRWGGTAVVTSLFHQEEVGMAGGLEQLHSREDCDPRSLPPPGCPPPGGKAPRGRVALAPRARAGHKDCVFSRECSCSRPPAPRQAQRQILIVLFIVLFRNKLRIPLGRVRTPIRSFICPCPQA